MASAPNTQARKRTHSTHKLGRNEILCAVVHKLNEAHRIILEVGRSGHASFRVTAGGDK